MIDWLVNSHIADRFFRSNDPIHYRSKVSNRFLELRNYVKLRILLRSKPWNLRYYFDPFNLSEKTKDTFERMKNFDQVIFHPSITKTFENLNSKPRCRMNSTDVANPEEHPMIRQARKDFSRKKVSHYPDLISSFLLFRFRLHCKLLANSVCRCAIRNGV